MTNNKKNTCRIGVGGPVGSGKTALIETLTPRLLAKGLKVVIITNDIVTTEEAKRWLEGAEPKKIIVVPGKIINLVK